jgi:GH43 family beta-xylosidase
MTTTPYVPRLSRRALLGAAGAAVVGGALRTGPFGGVAAASGWDRRRELTNPLVLQRADAQIQLAENGLYYMTASVPEYDRLAVRAARTLAGLGTATETVIWRRPTSGTMGGHIWAPEIHHIDGRWYCYFAAGDADDVFHIRTYVMASAAPDPREPGWGDPVRLVTAWDTFTLDSTTFVHRGTRYLAWAQSEPGIATNSNLYIAPLASPTELAAAPVRIAVPTLPWEIQGFKVNEGPAVLIRNGRVFMTFSASATDARYSIGLLTADADANLLDAASWVKSPEPVFVTSQATSVYGPGHNSFTVDERGRDILVYHGRDYRDIAATRSTTPTGTRASSGCTGTTTAPRPSASPSATGRCRCASRRSTGRTPTSRTPMRMSRLPTRWRSRRRSSGCARGSRGRERRRSRLSMLPGSS